MCSAKSEIASGVRYFTVATAGHVDHGKTSLLKELTGVDPDRLKEEKERQMTTDLGFVHLACGGLGIGFIDVPGHGKFLKNMLAGVGGIDLALLVVAADEGPMPQTRQHAKILSLLGVKPVILTITKCDLADESQTRAAVESASALVSASGLQEVGRVMLSCPRRTGFDTLKEALVSVLESLPPRPAGLEAFLPVDRVFNKAGFGTVVTGTLVRGRLSVGDKVMLQPGDMRARVRRLESLGVEVAAAGSGQRVAVNLVVKEGTGLARGHVVVGREIAPALSVVASLEGMADRHEREVAMHLAGADVRLYHGTAECHGQVRWVEPSPVADGGGPSVLLAQIALTRPLVAEPGDRYVLRTGDDTIFGGTLLVRDKPRWVTREKARELAASLLSGQPQDAVLSYLYAHPQQIVRLAQLGKVVVERSLDALVDELVGQGRICRLADFLATPEKYAHLQERVMDALSEDISVPTEHLRNRATPGLDRAAFQVLVDMLITSGGAERKGERLVLAGQGNKTMLDEGNLAAMARVVDVLSEHLCLEIDEIARLAGLTSERTRQIVDQLALSSQAYVVGYEFASSSPSIKMAHQVLARLWTERKEISPSEFREGLGTTRKYAMALLGYFDDHRITRRVKEGRVLLKLPD